MSRRWTETEYDRLFGASPPEGRRPADDEVARLAAEFVTGRSASTTSDALKTWLDRRSTGSR